MNAVAPVTAQPEIISAGKGSSPASLDGGVHNDAGDGAQFRAALERHMQSSSPPAKVEANKVSLGDRMMNRTSDLATEIKKDQQYVSKLLEQATRSADSMQLMKAMMAMNDYQMRVQFISKAASKATSALDQLTKLQ
ncbi:MAG: type III secretion protein [Herminiimonas sp.]|nr:type III secretion protein [Herminiimonas sp.]